VPARWVVEALDADEHIGSGGIAGASASISRGTRAPVRLASVTRARFSRQQSSFIARIRNRREAPKVPDTEPWARHGSEHPWRGSIDHALAGRWASGIGDRPRRARLRPRLRREIGEAVSCRLSGSLEEQGISYHVMTSRNASAMASGADFTSDLPGAMWPASRERIRL
jgi:hypothetical protein